MRIIYFHKMIKHCKQHSEHKANIVKSEKDGAKESCNYRTCDYVCYILFTMLHFNRIFFVEQCFFNSLQNGITNEVRDWAGIARTLVIENTVLESIRVNGFLCGTKNRRLINCGILRKPRFSITFF